MRRLTACTVALGCLVALGSCADGRDADTITLVIEGHEFHVEVAETLEEQRRGLMHRDRLPPDHGMLFVYDADQRLSFWMKNTHIPLSIAFISKDGRILEIHDMEPESLRSIESSRSVRYALELNQGAFERIGADVGSLVEFPEGF